MRTQQIDLNIKYCKVIDKTNTRVRDRMIAHEIYTSSFLH